jgi:uncharacterized protein with NAD-binding domain and iron-sulfur cluster
MGTTHETIIVGGGAAGMNCALKLQEAGKPYLLLTDRMGGRIMYRKDLKMNFAAVFYFGSYRHTQKILTPGPKVLPSLFQGCCRPTPRRSTRRSARARCATQASSSSSSGSCATSSHRTMTASRATAR